ncbi:hypothetical protein N9Z02_03005, partial [Akkermansiaceae bacterium]|nr:hypothetical protein [Akkermansiaceae bacterium]
MLRDLASISLLFFLPLTLSAQEIERTEVIHRNGRKITIEKIILPKEDERTLPKVKLTTADQRPVFIPTEPSQPEHSFMVHAIIYDQQTSFVTWSTYSGNKKENFSCWSNINWSYLQRLHKIQSDRGNFSFMLLSQNSSIESLKERKAAGEDINVPVVPPELTPLKEGGARYLLTIGDENLESPALEFIESVHELYDAEKRQLVNAHLEHLRDERIRKHQL